jgi:regulatory protein
MRGRRAPGDGAAAASASAPEPALRQDVLRYLRVRERTRREVADYLARRGHAPDLIARALAELEATGLIDDRRFARVYLRDRQRLHPLGRAAVLRELRARGVAPELAGEALAGCDPPWDEHELARAAVARRWSRWGAESRRERATRFLRTRGFEPAAIRAVVGELEDADARGNDG